MKIKLFNRDRVVLPGVGAFGDAMNRIREYGLEDVIKEVINYKTLRND